MDGRTWARGGPAGPLHAGGGLRLVRSAGLGLVLVEGSAGSGPGRAAGGDLPEGDCNSASPSGDGEGAAGGASAAPSTAFQIEDPGAAVSRGEGGAAASDLPPQEVITLIWREAYLFDAVGAPVARPPMEIQSRLLLFHRVNVSLDQINRVLRAGRGVTSSDPRP